MEKKRLMVIYDDSDTTTNLFKLLYYTILYYQLIVIASNRIWVYGWLPVMTWVRVNPLFEYYNIGVILYKNLS